MSWAVGSSVFTHGISEIRLGYVVGDDAVSYIDDIKALFKAIRPLVDSDDLDGPELKFPLIKTKKIKIWENLPKDLRQMISVCENPRKQKHCGDCVPCRKMKEVIGDESFSSNFNVYKEENIIENESKDQTIDVLDERVESGGLLEKEVNNMCFTCKRNIPDKHLVKVMMDGGELVGM